MNKKTRQLIMRVPDPFDDTSRARLAHMGVLDKQGQLNTIVMPAFARIFAGLFIDDLCDFFDDTKNLLDVYQTFVELNRKEDYQHMYLFISIQYDYIRKPLPDPIWWLAGDTAAVKVFMILFIECLNDFVIEAGLIEPGEEVIPL